MHPVIWQVAGGACLALFGPGDLANMRDAGAHILGEDLRSDDDDIDDDDDDAGPPTPVEELPNRDEVCLDV